MEIRLNHLRKLASNNCYEMERAGSNSLGSQCQENVVFITPDYQVKNIKRKGWLGN